MTNASAWTMWHSVGYAYAALAPAIPLRWISRLLWRQITVVQGVPTCVADANQNSELPALIGVLERILYVASILIGAKELVGVWLALKVAGGWELWKEGTTISWVGTDGRHKAEIGGRSFFNTFLIGTALSLLNAAAAAGAVEWGLRGHSWVASSQLFSAATVTAAVWVRAYCRWRSM